jgi:hypothetical protein
MAVLARSGSDEVISGKNKDCFAPLAMTLLRNLIPSPHKGRGNVVFILFSVYPCSLSPFRQPLPLLFFGSAG